MSNFKNDGGSVFPFTIDCDGKTGISKGMTLRDYFAAKAMQAIICNEMLLSNIVKDTMGTINQNSEISKQAYGISDAMLKQREV